jgi:hypothetical protein
MRHKVGEELAAPKEIVGLGENFERNERGISHDFMLFCIILAIGVLALAADILIYTEGFNGPTIRSDGVGYYAYLPSFFIYHDISLYSFLHDKPYALASYNGKQIDKYPMGTAILMAPFFFAADFLTAVTSLPRDGFSLIYQISIVVAGIFYLICGLVLTYRLLLLFYSNQIALVVLPLLTFGTGLFHYATYDASFSHVYSFFLVSAYLYALYRPSKSLADIIMPSVLLGLIFLTRMPNVVLGIFLVLCELHFLRQERQSTILLAQRWAAMLIAFSMVVSLQFAYYYVLTGHLFIWSYAGEAFNWLNPQILPVLFSVRKGLFFWYPILLLSVVGIPLLSRRLLLPTVLFQLVFLYIVSSWGSWWYGGSFGMRPYVDVVAVFALSLAAAINHISARSRYRRIVWSLAIALVIWTIFNMYLYWRGIVPFDGATLNIYYRIVQGNL